MIGSKERFFELFSSVGPVVHQVDLPGGEAIFVRELSAHQRSQYDLAMSDKKNGLDSLRERLVVLCACDADGKRLFGDVDTTLVGELPASLIEPIFEMARVVNGFVAKPVEDIRKNSETGTSGA